MTQEEKQLLLKDLCARLPYKVIVQVKDWTILDTELKTGHIRLLQDDYIELKPHLRAMSSMTEEEFEKLKEYSGLKYEQLDLASYQNETYKCLDFYLSEVPSYVVILVFDWLNAHHFDYRGLIEKDLALEAPKGMYN